MNKLCLLLGAVPYGTKCTSDQVCKGGGLCSNAKCVCPPLQIWATYSTNISSCVYATGANYSFLSAQLVFVIAATGLC